ncbi:MAG: ABC transporter permease [Bacteroidetes bacterium]|nr:MAG: ABC transporter permease [Bacteroidota bacterium]
MREAKPAGSGSALKMPRFKHPDGTAAPAGWPIRLIFHSTLAAMFRHHLIVAFRHLARHRAFSLVNLLGLTLGLTCALLIYAYVQHELTVDHFHTQADRIFRVTYAIRGDVDRTLAVTPNVVLPLARREFPEVRDGVRLLLNESLVSLPDQRKFDEDRVIWADSSFFNLFSFGDREMMRTALTRPRTVVLTESTARRYYGDRPAVGQVLFLGTDTTAYQVTGVIPDVPARSHLQFDLLVSFYSLGKWATGRETFSMANYYTYLLLNRPEDAAAVEARIPPILRRELGEDRASIISFALQPLKEVYLHSAQISYNPGQGDLERVYLFGAIAILILLIAGINYVNLTTARAVDRAREVGLRKVVGAHKGHLVAQFMGETLLLTLAGLFLASILLPVLMPVFSRWVGRELVLTSDWAFWSSFLGLGLAVAVLAGAYPALVLSRYRPISVLRGSFARSGRGLWLRQGLVVFQFAISILLIVSALVIQRQLHFVQSKQLGYDREHLLTLPLDRQMLRRLPALKRALMQLPGVERASACTESPHDIQGGYSIGFPGEQEEAYRAVRAMAIDEDFVATAGLELIAGSNFLPGVLEKEAHFFLLNEQAVQALGLTPAEALGRQVDLNGREGVIQGVVRDFHLASLREAISPLVLFNEYQMHTLLLRLGPADVAQTLAALEASWNEQVPHRPFSYEFVDEAYGRLYAEEQRMGSLFSVFAGLAIVIACLGLLGLSAYVTLRRTKEIGIRKVLGASVWSIVQLLSAKFTALVGLGFVVAAPLSWYLMDRWLMGFAYKVPVGVYTLVLAGLLVLLLAWVTVGYQAWQAASANPADSLRDE